MISFEEFFELALKFKKYGPYFKVAIKNNVSDFFNISYFPVVQYKEYRLCDFPHIKEFLDACAYYALAPSSNLAEKFYLKYVAHAEGKSCNEISYESIKAILQNNTLNYTPSIHDVPGLAENLDSYYYKTQVQQPQPQTQYQSKSKAKAASTSKSKKSSLKEKNTFYICEKCGELYSSKERIEMSRDYVNGFQAGCRGCGTTYISEKWVSLRAIGTVEE
jgi:hypothetical protein